MTIQTSVADQFELFCSNVGMSMTTAFTIFAKKTVHDNKIPFEIGSDMPNAETLEALEEVKRMKADKTLGKSYSNAEEMIKDVLG